MMKWLKQSMQVLMRTHLDNQNNEVFRYQDPETKALFADLWVKAKADTN